MNLCNPLPTPPGLRHCYWEAEYIASQPFCITSRLTDQENKDLSDFEEMRLFENLDIIKQDLLEEIKAEAFEEPLVVLLGSAIDAKKAVELYLAGPKKLYFCGYQKPAKRFGFCYTQTITPKLSPEFHQK